LMFSGIEYWTALGSWRTQACSKILRAYLVFPNSALRHVRVERLRPLTLGGGQFV
jgi:hypothetical protein